VARKNVADAAKAKAQKQKKIAIGLGVVLALAVAYAAHTMMAMGGGGSASKPQVATDTTAASAAPAPAATTAAPLPAAPSLAGAAIPGVTSSATSSVSTQLINAVQPPASAGQLQSFSLFESKDPFHASGPAPTSASSGSSGSGTTTKPPKTPPAPPLPPPTSAVISVNGASESVTTGAGFPAASPVFQLVSLTTTTARVSVAGGSYASGAPTLTLKVGKPVTLVNTADGTRYTLVLQPQGTVAPTPSASTTTPASTTPSG
jgi:hypothetical protein